MTLSFKILRYNYFVNSFISFIFTPAGILRYGWTPLQVSTGTDFMDLWNKHMDAYVGPLSNGHASVDAINADYLTGFTMTQGFRSQISGNSTITLTSDELLICNLKKASTGGSTTGIPKTSPALACYATSSLVLNFAAMNPAHLFKRAKGDGNDAIGLKMAITDAGAPPPKPEAYIRQEDETNTEFEMLFTSDQVGKTVYLIGFYINAKGVAGKDGLPCVVTIV